MTNNGAKTASLNCGGSYTIPVGYHNGSGKVTANSLASQTSATATAAVLASGYTAWVNGKLITGTRSAVVTSQSGNVTVTDVKPSKQHILNFPKSFDKTPTVTAVVTKATYPVNSADWTSSTTVSVSNITRSSCVLNVKHTAGSSYAFTAVISWSAQA